MNYRPRTAVSTIMLLACATAALLATAHPAAAQIPPAARSAADAKPYKADIDAFVKLQVARLNDTKTQGNIRQARVQLEAQVGGNPTPSFLQVYAASLNAAVQPLAGAKDLITRLNAAIIVAHVAEKAKNAELAPAAAKFMNDPQDAVALWGVKAAKHIIPALLNNNPAQDPLSPILLDVVKKNWFSGAIVYEAYDAYRLNTNAPGALAPAGQQQANPAAIKAAVSGMMGLLSFRAELYAKGIPPQPRAENIAADFLGRQAVWQQMTAPQQTQLVQSLLNIVSFAGQHCTLLDAEPRGGVAEMLKSLGSLLYVIGGFANDPVTTAAAGPVRSFGISTPGDVIFSTTTDSVGKIIASTKWKAQLKAPPAIGDAAGTILSPNEPLEEETAPAPTASGGGAGTTGAPAKGAGTPAATGGTGSGAGATGAEGAQK